MYKITFLLITIILTFHSPPAFASTDSNVIITSYGYNHYDGEKFTFVEKGITFSIFRNGEFDFYINPGNGRYTNVDLGSVSISYNAGYNYEAYVQYDDYGAIIQIEGVPIYYDYYGRIVGAGNVKVNYFSNRLVRIGGMHIYYNGFGYYSHYRGYINTYNRYYAYHPYNNYFVRPYYNRCIVSYNPYRRHYKPYRYSYNYGRSYHNKNYKKNKPFKKIDSRVRTADSGKGYHKRLSNDNRISRNNNTLSAQNRQRNVISNSDRSNRIRPYVKDQVSKRHVQSTRNRATNSEFRMAQNTKKEGSPVSQKRRIGLRNTQEKNVKQHKTVQRSRTNNIKQETKHSSGKNMTQRTSSRSKSYKQTKVKNSIRKKSIPPRSKRNVASR